MRATVESRFCEPTPAEEARSRTGSPSKDASKDASGGAWIRALQRRPSEIRKAMLVCLLHQKGAVNAPDSSIPAGSQLLHILSVEMRPAGPRDVPKAT